MKAAGAEAPSLWLYSEGINHKEQKNMRTILNYTVCSFALFVAMVMMISGSLVWTALGLAWCGMLYATGVAFPNYWKRFWVTNIRILAHMGLL